MSYNIGQVKFLTITPDGALDPNPNVLVAVDNPSVVSATPVAGDPLKFKLDFLSVGVASLNASAFSANGQTVTGTITIDVAPAAATTLSLAITDA